jgi:hypothetical protein
MFEILRHSKYFWLNRCCHPNTHDHPFVAFRALPCTCLSLGQGHGDGGGAPGSSWASPLTRPLLGSPFAVTVDPAPTAARRCEVTVTMVGGVVGHPWWCRFSQQTTDLRETLRASASPHDQSHILSLPSSSPSYALTHASSFVDRVFVRDTP